MKQGGSSKGRRALLSPRAPFSVFQECCDFRYLQAGEYNRQVRITNRTLRALMNFRTLMNPLRYPRFAFCLASHKLMKFLTPVFMIVALFANLLLAGSSLVYAVFLAGQICFYGAGMSCLLRPRTQAHHCVLNIIYSFCMVNLAMLNGWITFFKGKTYTTWSPERD